MIEILIEIGLWLVIGFLIGCVTNFIEYIIGEPYLDEMYRGRILSVVGLWLRKRYDELENRIALNTAPKDAHQKLNWYKALGVCPFCFNVYVTWIISICLALFTPLSWWGIFITLPIAHVSLGWLMSRDWW
jgi:hypothetical protein